jgi:hypothetical protein
MPHKLSRLGKLINIQADSDCSRKLYTTGRPASPYATGAVVDAKRQPGPGLCCDSQSCGAWSNYNTVLRFVTPNSASLSNAISIKKGAPNVAPLPSNNQKQSGRD